MSGSSGYSVVEEQIYLTSKRMLRREIKHHSELLESYFRYKSKNGDCHGSRDIKDMIDDSKERIKSFSARISVHINNKK